MAAIESPSVIFVCSGNICRSPMAEGILRTRAVNVSRKLSVSSMGTLGIVGHGADEGAIAACRKNGVDISSHRSRALIPAELASATHVFTMDLLHKELVVEACPSCADRVSLLGSWPGPDRVEDRVPDPIGGSVEFFCEIYELIDESVVRVLEGLT